MPRSLGALRAERVINYSTFLFKGFFHVWRTPPDEFQHVRGRVSAVYGVLSRIVDFSSEVSPAFGRRLLVVSLCRGGQRRVFACQHELKL